MAGFTTVVLTSAASDVVVCSLTLIVNDVADFARSACYDISHSQLLQCLIIKSATRWRKNSIQDTGICDCLSMALDTQSNQFFPSVCVFVNRSVVERLRPQSIITKFCMRLINVVASTPVVCETNRK